MRRSEALSARQAAGERFQQFTARVRGLVIDCQYKLPCPHAAAGHQSCATAGCGGVDYSTAMVKDVLLNGIADADIKREILSNAMLGTKSVQEVVTVVEAKEAARDTVLSGRAAQAAASSTFKNAAKGRAPATPAANPTLTSGPPHIPREKKCRCGNAYFDYAERSNGGCNARPYKECRDCCLYKRKAEKRSKKGGKKTNAAAHTFRFIAAGTGLQRLTPHQRHTLRPAKRGWRPPSPGCHTHVPHSKRFRGDEDRRGGGRLGGAAIYQLSTRSAA